MPAGSKDSEVEPRFRNVNEANRYMYENIETDYDVTINVYEEFQEPEKSEDSSKSSGEGAKEGDKSEEGTGTGTGEAKEKDKQESSKQKQNKSGVAHAHMYILKSRCPKLVQKDDEGKDKKEFDVDGISVGGFKEVLRFLYYERTQLTPTNSFEVMYFAKKYDIPVLERIASKYISDNITVKTVCYILATSIKYKDQPLREKCDAFISNNTKAVLNDSSFYKSDEKVLDEITSLDYMDVDELHLIQSCVSWARGGPSKQSYSGSEPIKGEELREKLKLPLENKRFRFPTLQLNDFNVCIVPLDLLDETDTVDIYNYLACPTHNKPKTKFSMIKRHMKRGAGARNSESKPYPGKSPEKNREPSPA